MSIATLFDYGTLDVETRVVVQQKTTEIKERVRRSREDILAIGERLADIKQRLGHGAFGRWLEVEFGWSDRFAQELMNVARVFKTELSSDLDITPTALRSLAAPSVPQPARQEAIETARNGNHVGTREVERIIERHKPDVPQSKPVLDLFRAEDDRAEQQLQARPPDTEPSQGQVDQEDNSEAERRRKHFLRCLNDIDDLTRAVAARVHHGGYDGFPVVFSQLQKKDKLRVRGKIEILIERLQGWSKLIREDAR